MKTLGVYVQIPFCSSKCTFCNFSSKVAPPDDLQAYLASLASEIDLLPSLREAHPPTGRRASVAFLELPVDSVYLGGGTPTLAGRDRLERILAALQRRLRFTDAPEITLEMTPGSADIEMLSTCRTFGINRLSVGAQSFEDRELRNVGRLHSAGATGEQVRVARAAGFDNISLDLIAGLPYQTETSWLATLRQAIELEPEHVSVYLFEIDEKSALGSEVLRHGSRYRAAAVPDDNFMAAAYEQARTLLAEAGYVQYEISNFARSGFYSRHNCKYWRLEPYLGVGAGAHSFDGRARWANEIATDRYAARLRRRELPIAEWHSLAEEEQIEEFFFLGLRQRDGVDLGSAASSWGAGAMERWQPRIRSLLKRGMLEEADGHVRLAPQAYLISNEVFQEFLS